MPSIRSSRSRSSPPSGTAASPRPVMARLCACTWARSSSGVSGEPSMARSASARWAAHASAWREPAQILAHWNDAAAVDAALLRHRVTGPWWEILDELDVSLLVSREYEHLLLSLATRAGRPQRSFMPLPHPSGVAFDQRGGSVHVASTRNPNQIVTLKPISSDSSQPESER